MFRIIMFTGVISKCGNHQITKAAGIKLLTDVDNHKDQIFSELSKAKLMVNTWDLSIKIENKKIRYYSKIGYD